MDISSDQLWATPTAAPPSAARRTGDNGLVIWMTTSGMTATNATARMKLGKPFCRSMPPGPRVNVATTNITTGKATSGRRRSAGSEQIPASTIAIATSTTNVIERV